MQKEECWKSFFTSGKVSDYLAYCNAENETYCDKKDAEGKSIAAGDASNDKRKHNAGFY